MWTSNCRATWRGKIGPAFAPKRRKGARERETPLALSSKTLLLAAVALLASSAGATAQTVSPQSYRALHWRFVGPLRGGRTVGLSGVAAQPNVFYIAAVNGGIWRTQDAGHTWMPIFDGQPTGSIGALAVAPSDPRVIYAGSGEGLQRPDLAIGDGVYKSNDGGQTWAHLGLRDGQQIAGMAVDPDNAQRLFVAVLGHPYGPNQERGIYRSLDGGATFQRVLFVNDERRRVCRCDRPARSSHGLCDAMGGTASAMGNRRVVRDAG